MKLTLLFHKDILCKGIHQDDLDDHLTIKTVDEGSLQLLPPTSFCRTVRIYPNNERTGRLFGRSTFVSDKFFYFTEVKPVLD
jgi:hypothetical protein